MFKFFFFFILLGLFSGFCEKTKDSSAKFGEKVKFAQNLPVKFEGFSLTYIGERQIAVSNFPGGFLYYDFQAKADGEEKTVSWTSGTGDIGPVPFIIDGKKYELELRISDKLGNLDENELVVWKK